jgi:hypothetical protein
MRQRDDFPGSTGTGRNRPGGSCERGGSLSGAVPAAAADTVFAQALAKGLGAYWQRSVTPTRWPPCA